jgi:hypothetical protein
MRKALCEKLLAVAPDKVISMPFVLSLSQHQRELLINTMMDGDGCRSRTGTQQIYAQKNKAHVDAFVALCALAGYRTYARLVHAISFGKPVEYYLVSIYSDKFHHALVSSIDFHGGKRVDNDCIGQGKHEHPNEPTIDYNGRVWCPETEYGSFMARRNGKIFLSGNSYVSDMRGQALVQLAQVGLQFDESRSANPFAWYTQIIKNVFRRIWLLERRNQDIRDDLLMMAGALPSYTRQVDDEVEQREIKPVITTEASSIKELPKRRGRKPKVRD